MASVREQIIENIKTTLETITQGVVYENSIASVQRWMQRGNKLYDTPCIVINEGEESKEPVPQGVITCHLNVTFDLWTVQDESDDTATGTYLNSFLRDIEKALLMDTTRGGKAQDTKLQSIIPFETVEGQAYAGLIIEVEIRYRHLEGDPDTAI